MEKDAGAARRAFPVGHAIDLRAPGALFRRHDEDTCRSQTHHRRTRFGFAWGLGYDGSHLASGCHREKRPGSALPYGTEGGVTVHLPDKKQMSIYDAAMQYQKEGTPLVVIAGKEYGTGSSRDWAAKGPRLLGIKAAIAESFERIHRSNLIGMGIVPLVFKPGENLKTHGLTGFEKFDILGIGPGLKLRQELTVKATADDGKTTEFKVICRIDTPAELDYYRHGGILEYVLRQLLQN